MFNRVNTHKNNKHSIDQRGQARPLAYTYIGFSVRHQDETIYNHGVNIKTTNPSLYVEFHDGNHYVER